MIKKLATSIVALLLTCSLALAQANYFGRGAVTQATSATTAVTLDKPSGVITTVALTNAAGITTSFTLNNNNITATSNVQVTIDDYSGTITTNGIPYVNVDAPTAGSCVIQVTNLGAANALSGTVKIGFLVVN